jgi:hypothetical protein
MINANKGLIEDKDMQVLDLYDSKTGEFAMPLPYVIGEKVNIPQGLTSIKPDKSLTAKEERKLALDERRVEALEKGVALREKNVNEKTAKTNIKSYRDPYTGTTKYYDLNNPDEAKIVKGAGVINPKTGKPKYVLEEISSFKKQDAEDETINTPYGKTNTNTSKKLYENYK